MGKFWKVWNSKIIVEHSNNNADNSTIIVWNFKIKVDSLKIIVDNSKIKVINSKVNVVLRLKFGISKLKL